MAFDPPEWDAPAAERLAVALHDAAPQAILAEARLRFGRHFAVVSSFGAESAVLLHMTAQVDPSIPVLFLDTGMLFAQTLDYRRNLAAQLGLTDVRDLRPRFDDLALHDPDSDLWRGDIDGCCRIRKVLPLDHALTGFSAWATGRKRFHGGERAGLKAVEWAAPHVKFNPLASWDQARLQAYADEHALPAHPLVAAGFPSIGCWPCTKATAPGEDVRAGRWAGSQKTECGIHTARAPGTAPFVGGDI